MNLHFLLYFQSALLQGLCDDDVDYGLDLVVEGEELPVLDLSGDVDACLLGDELRIGLLVPEGVRLRFYLRQAERRRVVVVQEELKVSLDSGVPRRLYFVRRHYLLLLLEVQQLTLHTLQFHPFRFQLKVFFFLTAGIQEPHLLVLH